MMNQTSMNGIPCTQMRVFLEDLLKKNKITDYTYDGWVQLHSREWYPTKVACKHLGDEVYNEYLEHGR